MSSSPNNSSAGGIVETRLNEILKKWNKDDYYQLVEYLNGVSNQKFPVTLTRQDLEDIIRIAAGNYYGRRRKNIIIRTYRFIRKRFFRANILVRRWIFYEIHNVLQ